MVIDRSDIEAVLVVIFEDLFSSENSELAIKPSGELVDIFLDAASFSKHGEGYTESGMSYEDFRSWCSLLPSVRKFLGNLLMPPDPGFLFSFFFLSHDSLFLYETTHFV